MSPDQVDTSEVTSEELRRMVMMMRRLLMMMRMEVCWRFRFEDNVDEYSNIKLRY